jgi:hypothetical protein
VAVCDCNDCAEADSLWNKPSNGERITAAAQYRFGKRKLAFTSHSETSDYEKSYCSNYAVIRLPSWSAPNPRSRPNPSNGYSIETAGCIGVL